MLQKWNGCFFECTNLKELGLVVQLEHDDSRDCYCPECGHINFLVIDVNGIHSVTINFCGCDQHVSHHQQLLRCGWYPATVHNPQTACTQCVLDHFLHLTWSSKVSAYEYYQTLERLTDNTGIDVPKSRYPTFLWMIRQYRNVKNGIHTTQAGQLALVCPACPHPNINLPEGWEDADASLKFLYWLILTMDANFWLKNRNQSSDVADPGLHTGLAYFIPNQPYEEHILKYVSQDNISTCSVGLCLCACHEFVRPTVVGDLQKGEQYCNMDYIFFSAIVPLLLLSVMVSYDIACQWKLNLWKRMAELPEPMYLPLAVAMFHFAFGIPKFHCPAHATECAIPHSLNLMPAGIERNWSKMNHVGNSTKEMGPGARHNTLNDHFGHHNWRKYVGLGELH
ncbi:hypothetical protein BDN67DRAFT_992665 [Paxillus ammoniavirescens]|nr:hypothetical protein BDN67DRAFT_992665 [Paxillus ammoniavirescens]